MLPVIPNDHLIRICKYRCGPSCCKYIVYLTGQKNFCCAKNDENAKNYILQVKNMSAQGDNCEGLYAPSPTNP